MTMIPGKKLSEAGVVLRASEFSDGPDPMFLLGSGKCQDEFVSLWKIMDHEDLFESFKQEIIKLVKDLINIHGPFSALITCTQTSKYLVDHIHADLEIGNQAVQCYYLGNFPYLDPNASKTFHFEGKRVLIITDVLASGNLATQLGNQVVKEDGIPLAVVCAVSISSQLKEVQLTVNGRRKIPVYSACEYDIVSYDQDALKEKRSSLEKDLEEARKQESLRVKLKEISSEIKAVDAEIDRLGKCDYVSIDPVTLLPRKKNEDDAYPALINRDIMYEHFKAAKCLQYDLHECDKRKFTIAVRFKPLLELQAANAFMMGVLGDKLSRSAQYITTFGAADKMFAHVVISHLGIDDVMKVPKCSTSETSSSYFFLPNTKRPVGEVVVLLATCHTSEKLRNIVSLLAMEKVTKITVVTLLNRMGRFTNKFIGQVKKLLSGLGEHRDADFEFLAIYSVSDLNQDKVSKLQHSITHMISDYAEKTSAPAFQLWAEHELKYFLYKSTTCRSFLEAIPLVLPVSEPDSKSDERLILEKEMLLDQQELKLAYLCEKFIGDRNSYGLILDEIFKARGKDYTYKLYNLLFTEIDFLKLTRKAEDIRIRFIKEIQELQALRFDIEHGRFDKESSWELVDIDDVVRDESYFIFGLAVLAHLDQSYNYNDVISDLFFCGKTPGEWLDNPINFVATYTNDRFVWCLAFFAAMSQPNFFKKGSATELKTGLKDDVKKLLGLLEDGVLVKGENASKVSCYLSAKSQDSAMESKIESSPALGVVALNKRDVNALINKIKTNFNFVIKDLDGIDQERIHSSVRLLHSNLVYIKKHHSQIRNSLQKAKNDLSIFADPPWPMSGVKTGHIHQISRVILDHVAEDWRADVEEHIWRTKGAVEDAFFVSGLLIEIFRAVKALFKFSSRDLNMLYSYGNPKKIKDLSVVHEMARVLHSIRTGNAFSDEEINVLQDTIALLERWLWEANSPLRDLMMNYITPLKDPVLHALNDANEMLKTRFSLEGVWDETIVRLQGVELDCLVLIDKPFLVEVLKNLLTNVRHSLKPGSSFSQMPLLEIIVPEGDPETITLNVCSWGDKPFKEIPSSSTTQLQQANILEMGGELTYFGSMVEGRYSTTATFKLFARNKPPVLD